MKRTIWKKFDPKHQNKKDDVEKIIAANPIIFHLFAPIAIDPKNDKFKRWLCRLISKFNHQIIRDSNTNTYYIQNDIDAYIDLFDTFFGRNALQHEIKFIYTKAEECNIQNICLQHGFRETTTIWVMWDKNNPDKKEIFPSSHLQLIPYGATLSNSHCAEMYLFDHVLFEFLTQMKTIMNIEMEIRHLYIPALIRFIKQLKPYVLDHEKWLQILCSYEEAKIQDEFAEYCPYLNICHYVPNQLNQCMQAIYAKRTELELAGLWEQAHQCIQMMSPILAISFDTTKKSNVIRSNDENTTQNNRN